MYLDRFPDHPSELLQRKCADRHATAASELTKPLATITLATIRLIYALLRLHIIRVLSAGAAEG